MSLLSLRLSSRLFPSTVRAYSNVRDGAGAFGKKEKAAEDKYVREHDKELTKHLAADLASKKTAAPAKKKPSTTLESKPKSKQPKSGVDPLMQSSVSSTYGGAARSGGGKIGEREAAMEDKVRATPSIYKFNVLTVQCKLVCLRA